MNQHAAASLSAKARLALCIGAMGVVFGDIGTSPLYAFRESIEHLPVAERGGAALGVLSLIFWSLLLVVSLKYLTVVMRADNDGEGGVFALLALGRFDRRAAVSRRLPFGVIVLLIGAAMICGEGVITPAISVLSASEGLKVIWPEAEKLVIPVCITILVALFWVQHRGTKAIGQLFGPVMLVWFSTLGLLGLWHVLQTPAVLAAVNPLHIVTLVQHHP